MAIGFFVKGLLGGLLVALPVGPVGIVCIHRTLTGGRLRGLIAGLGAAAADTLYGLIAAAGLTFVSSFLASQRVLVAGVGGAVLCIVGVKTFLSKKTAEARIGNGFNHAGNFGSTFLLTLTNPMTIVVLAAVFAGLGTSGVSVGSVVLLVAGVSTGSTFWWVTISNVAGLYHGKIGGENLVRLNKISGAIITVFGLFVFSKVFV